MVCGAGFMTGIGSVVVATTGSAPTGAMARRGHSKSSLRPAGGKIASPFTSTRVTDFGADASPVSREPINSCAEVTEAVSGTTGPASGRAAGPLGLAAMAGACGSLDGSATGSEPGAKHASDFTLEIMRELARAGPGEMHAVAGAQPADLAFEVGALRDEAAAVVDEAVPHVDVAEPGLLDAGAVEVVEILHVARRFRPAD